MLVALSEGEALAATAGLNSPLGLRAWPSPAGGGARLWRARLPRGEGDSHGKGGWAGVRKGAAAFPSKPAGGRRAPPIVEKRPAVPRALSLGALPPPRLSRRGPSTQRA